ncbi:MAG: response regulator [Clostridia bacterium]|nr:response regulator [Clostridia bacterium]
MNELYRLIIADDERQIREGLSTVVDWKTLGFEVVGVFSDGTDVISFLDNNMADVVLTDIRMAHVSGLDVARYVSTNCKNTKVILLTGYKDFEYAKAACEYGVYHYLLKPTELPELHDVFVKLRKQFDEQKKERKFRERSTRHLPEHFLSELYFGVFRNDRALSGTIKLLGIEEELSGKSFSVLELHIDNYDKMNKHGYGKVQVYKAMRHFMELKFPNASFAVPYQEAETVTYIAYGHGVPTEQLAQTIASELSATMGLSVNVSIKGEYQNIYMLAAALRSESDSELVDLKHLIERQKLLFSCLFSGEKEQAMGILASITQSLSGVDDDTVYAFMSNLFGLLAKKIADLGIVCENEYFEVPNPAGGRESIITASVKNMSKITDLMINHLSGAENITINKAKEFIMENYSKDILLEDVANHVFLSPAYLSRIFKKCVGESFSSYLFSIRINRAKALLKNSNLRVYEIAEKVGIQTPKYFFKLFKDHTGLTPSEYRARIESEEAD